MSRKKIIVLVVAVVIIAAALYAWREYNREVKDLDSVKADVNANAIALINEFLQDEANATKKYQDKIMAVTGIVKQVITIENTFTVVMGDTSDLNSVRCLIDSTHTNGISALQRGMQVTVKGAVTGFKKDETGLLGSDVELNRAVVQQQ